MVSEDPLDSPSLRQIVVRCGCAVCVDVVHLLRTDAGAIESELHRPGDFVGIGRRGRDMVGIGTEPVAGHLRIDPGPSVEGMLPTLQDDDAGTFSHDKPASPGVKGPARLLGLVVVLLAHGIHIGK